MKSDLWWHGPNWLVDRSQWPIPPLNVPNYIPKTCENVFLTFDVPFEDSLISDEMEKCFGSWYSYVRMFKLIISYCLLSSIGKLTRLTEAAQYKRAEQCLFTLLQHKYFTKVFVELKNNTQPNPKLQYFLHTDGLICCKGRFNSSSSLLFEVVCPILLPKYPLVRTLIHHIHGKYMHIGPEHTLSKVRERFWIIGARPFIKSVVHNCITCCRWEGGKFALPPMPPLPSIRTVEVAPFLHTAVDLFGPLYILNDINESVKCWVCIFVCLVTRAIHLEIVKDLSGNEFLLALSRFTSRRGLPKFILFDNGANFRFVQPLVGPSNPIRISHFRLNQYLSSNTIQWSFIPALAPWFGGAYERLIRIVKSCLKKSFGFVSLNLIELQTVLCQAEDIINTRPISYVSSDVMQPLTPNHFLRMRNINVDTHMEVTVAKLPVMSRHLLAGWQKVHSTLEYYWSQFRSLYLLNLQQFQTSLHRKEKGEIRRFPRLNELVLLHDPYAPRREWKIGKVVKIDKTQVTATILIPQRNTEYLSHSQPNKTPPNRILLERSFRLLHPLEFLPIDT